MDHDARHHSSLNSKYVTDSSSQDSNDQGSNSGNTNENESQEDCMEIGEEKASESGDLQFRGQFLNKFDAFFSNSEKNPCSHTCVCIGCGYDKNGRHYKTSEELTNDIQYMVMRRTKTMNTDLNSRVRYLKLSWVNPHHKAKYGGG